MTEMQVAKKQNAYDNHFKTPASWSR